MRQSAQIRHIDMFSIKVFLKFRVLVGRVCAFVRVVKLVLLFSD